jgi:hypothetical protein
MVVGGSLGTLGGLVGSFVGSCALECSMIEEFGGWLINQMLINLNIKENSKMILTK